jgi:protein TonB
MDRDIRFGICTLDGEGDSKPEGDWQLQNRGFLAGRDRELRRTADSIPAEYGIAEKRVRGIIDATRFGFVDQMVTSGLFKTALSISLLLHAAGFGAIWYFNRPSRFSAPEIVAQRPMLTIVAAPESENAASTESVAVAPVQAAAPVNLKAEEIPTPPPENEPVVEIPEPVATRPIELPQSVAVPRTELKPDPPPVTSAPPIATAPAESVANANKSGREVGPIAPNIDGRAASWTQPNYRGSLERFYPPEAIRLRQEGVVVVKAVLDEHGIPQSVEVKQSSGYRLLDEEAVREVKARDFEPARMNGQPVGATVEVPVNFKLSK